MSDKIQVLTQSSEGLLATDVSTNVPVTIQAQPGVNYELRDMESQIAPQQTLITRNGDNLELRFGDATNEAPVFILVGYYTLETASPLIGLAESGLFHQYVPQTAEAELLAWNLDEGESSFQSLGYYGESSEVPWWPILLGALLLGGGAVAIASSGSSDDGSTDTVAPDAPVIDATDGEEITGTAEAGSTVKVDVDGDGIPDQITEADENGEWSVTPDAPLADGTEVSATATD
ncbi:Ig-like domain-containing protein, partial [Psychromonas aquatilis]